MLPHVATEIREVTDGELVITGEQEGLQWFKQEWHSTRANDFVH